MNRSVLALVGILLLAVLLPLIPAGRRVLWESNEARYPVLAQDILEHGRWLVPEVRGRAWVAMTVVVALSLAGISVLTGIRYPARHARDYDVRPLAAAATSHAGPGGTVYGYPDLRLAYDFYLRRPAGELATIDRTLRALANPKAGQVLITSRERWRELSSRVTSPGRVLAARTLAGHEIVVVGSP